MATTAIHAPILKTESLPQARRRRIRLASTSGSCAGALRCTSGPRPSALLPSQPLSLVEPIGAASDMSKPSAAKSRGRAWRRRESTSSLTHPRLAQTGLDLLDFPTMVWFETEFSVFQSTQKSTVLMGSRFECNRG